jgi:hypothetical protein
MRLPRPSRTFARRLPWNRRLCRRGPRPPDVSPLDVWSTSEWTAQGDGFRSGHRPGGVEVGSGAGRRSRAEIQESAGFGRAAPPDPTPYGDSVVVAYRTPPESGPIGPVTAVWVTAARARADVVAGIPVNYDEELAGDCAAV